MHKNSRLRLPSPTGREEEEDEEEGAKMSFKIIENQICISLDSKYIYKTKKFVRVKSLMGFKIWSIWGVDKRISKSA